MQGNRTDVDCASLCDCLSELSDYPPKYWAWILRGIARTQRSRVRGKKRKRELPAVRPPMGPYRTVIAFYLFCFPELCCCGMCVRKMTVGGGGTRQLIVSNSELIMS